MSLLLAALLMGQAHAVPGEIRPMTSTVPILPPTIEELARDLDDSDRPTRLLAARDLRRRVRVAIKAGGRPGSIAELEARAELAALTRAVVPACISALADPALLTPCSDILARLGEPEACAPLSAVLQTTEGRPRKAVERAVHRLAPVCNPASE